MIVCQDRLGTNVSKVTQQETWLAFSKTGDQLDLDVCALCTHPRDDATAGKKTHILFHFMILKLIILPRQARDKHRESTQKASGVFS
jgi:hypothetical protein